MPDQSSAASEHAIIQEITAPLSTMPDDPVSVAADPHFPVAIRGYDRIAVDAYVKQTSQLVAELQATRSPEAAIKRALERVGEQISGILQRAHDTAEQITSQSRSEGEDRLEAARQEAARITAAAEQRLKDLDADTDRIWAERRQIVEDTRELAGQLLGLTDSAAERFPAAETSEEPVLGDRPEPAEPPEFYEPGGEGEPGPTDTGATEPGTHEDGVHETGQDDSDQPYDIEGDSDTAFQDADDSPTVVIDRAAIEDEAADKESTIVMPPRPADGSQDRDQR